LEGRGRRINVSNQPRKKHETLLINILKQKRAGSVIECPEFSHLSRIKNPPPQKSDSGSLNQYLSAYSLIDTLDLGFSNNKDINTTVFPKLTF
jgi:hypothetical protein